jgi:hypothetical protein
MALLGGIILTVYPCFIFKTKTLTVSIKEAPLAMIMGNSLSMNPYISQKNTPIVKNTCKKTEALLASVLKTSY